MRVKPPGLENSPVSGLIAVCLLTDTRRQRVWITNPGGIRQPSENCDAAKNGDPTLSPGFRSSAGGAAVKWGSVPDTDLPSELPHGSRVSGTLF